MIFSLVKLFSIVLFLNKSVYRSIGNIRSIQWKPIRFFMLLVSNDTGLFQWKIDSHFNGYSLYRMMKDHLENILRSSIVEKTTCWSLNTSLKRDFSLLILICLKKENVLHFSCMYFDWIDIYSETIRHTSWSALTFETNECWRYFLFSVFSLLLNSFFNIQ